MAIDEDRFYKVWPIFEHLNKTAKIDKADKYLSVDEVMVPYYGRHINKSFIRRKTFKLWLPLNTMELCSMLNRIAAHIQKFLTMGWDMVLTFLGKSTMKSMKITDKKSRGNMDKAFCRAIQIPAPNSIQTYDTHMRGRDLFDQQVGAY
ncbi:unnamed protein product [Lepeophtheirus salmonis]|uniref:(salmon louse) hypothetical protein n=1 Tax=Lepeophtheirus salmonis TaxID=72036 RepID=A0A7R8CII9_LEPSM|nr:unnamed protein product [Lepeophtheirus salmonis]CAF2827329.1 unnamed protein product [Lepeophtheirus salmonis]